MKTDCKYLEMNILHKVTNGVEGEETIILLDYAEENKLIKVSKVSRGWSCVFGLPMIYSHAWNLLYIVKATTFQYDISMNQQKPRPWSQTTWLSIFLRHNVTERAF